jgi:aspartate-semialdehyde dehydrogenase
MAYPVVGIIGAMGIAGSDLVGFLESELVTNIELRLFDESNLDDVLCTFKGEEIQLEEFNLNILEQLDIAVFVDQSLVRPSEHLDLINSLDLKVIDCTGSFSNSEASKLFFAPTSDKDFSEEKVVSIPAPSVSQFVAVASSLKVLGGIERVVVNSWEPVSTAGQLAMDELWEQGIAIYNQQPIATDAFEHQIIFNCIPQVGVIDELGITTEENRFIEQSRELLKLSDLKISTTLIRAPIFYCINQSVSIFFKDEIATQSVIELLKDTPTIDFYGDVSFYPMSINVITNNGVHVGRLRILNGCELHYWSVSDNVYFGLGENVIRLLEMMLKK